MIGRKQISLLILFILFSNIILAQTTPTQPPPQQIDPATKIYFDQQNQKIIAQLGSKIETEGQKSQTVMTQKVNEMQGVLAQEIDTKIKSYFIAIAVGLTGLIIIVLSVFRIIEFKMMHTRKIQKYEDELVKQMKEVELIKTNNLKFKTDLDNYRKQLVEISIKEKVKVDAPKYPTEKRKINWKSILKFLIIWGAILLFVGIIILAFVYIPPMIPKIPLNGTGA